MRLIPSDPDIRTIVERIRDGSLELQPDFQRGSVWSKPKQRLLVDSVLRNWYVPPIHVVRTDDDEQVVLDGQQRLQAIYDFVRGRITVDGRAEPHSQDIAALDGSRYDDLPDRLRRRFDRFTIRVFEVIDYETEEPYELFYRLNQPTTLTSAEKRNAFFGIPREQVKDLTEFAIESGLDASRVGFSNARLAHEDVVARFVYTLELGTLGEKVTANRVTERYRKDDPFPESVVNTARVAISSLFEVGAIDQPEIRFNKATTHSWLCFVARSVLSNQHLESLSDFVVDVEHSRARARQAATSETDDSSELDQHLERLYLILNDRATARVNDVTSVLLRDATLWMLYGAYDVRCNVPTVDQLWAAATQSDNTSQVEKRLLETIEQTAWAVLQ